MASTTFSDTDFLVVGIVFGNIVKFLGLIGSIIAVVVMQVRSYFKVERIRKQKVNN